jgi:hypothetical protein
VNVLLFEAKLGSDVLMMLFNPLLHVIGMAVTGEKPQTSLTVKTLH